MIFDFYNLVVPHTHSQIAYGAELTAAGHFRVTPRRISKYDYDAWALSNDSQERARRLRQAAKLTAKKAARARASQTA
jgi:hypothetical protein